MKSSLLRHFAESRSTWLHVTLFLLVSALAGCSDSGSEGPDPCEPGFSGSECAQCPAGTYCPGGAPDSALLYDCSAGTWDHDGNPATECERHTTCGDDEWLVEPGTATVDAICQTYSDCPPGTFVSPSDSETEDVSCTNCAAGTFSTDISVSECSEKRDCGPGTFVVEEGGPTEDRTCAACEAGTFSDGSNVSECRPVSNCPPGTFVEAEATATSDTVCSMCPTGTYSANNNEPDCRLWKECAPGQFVETPGTSTADRDCAACRSGTYSQTTNASSCQTWTNCSPGEFVDESGTTTSDRTCTACSTGTFSTTENAPSCGSQPQCPPATYKTDPGNASTQATCTACSVGEFCPGGAVTPTACNGQTWDHDHNPGTECVPWTACIPGEYVLSDGSPTTDRTCQNCAFDTYSDSLNLQSCKPTTICVPGEFAEARSTSSSDRVCASCPVGEFTAISNRPSCAPWSDCPAGTTIDAAPSSTSDRICASCPAGTFNTSTNQTTCDTWTVCVDDELVWKDGLPNRDRICEPCAATETSVGPNATTCVLRDIRPATDPVSLISPGATTCALLASNGQAVCWGANPEGVIDETPPASFSDIAAGLDAVCGIRTRDSRLECWGAPLSLDPSWSEDRFTDVVAGRYMFCAIREADGSMECFRDFPFSSNDYPIVQGTGLFAPHLADRKLCALTEPNGGFTCRHPFSQAIQHTGSDYRDLSIYDGGTCVITSTGAVECLGPNIPFPPGTIASDIEGGGCYLDAAGLLNCPLSDDPGSLQSDSGTFDQLESRDYGYQDLQVCGRTSADRKTRCWGANRFGQTLGVPESRPFREIELSAQSCALTQSGELSCFGEVVPNSGRNIPPANRQFDTFSTHVLATCATDAATRHVECWGTGEGANTRNLNNFIPMRALAVGGRASCAIAAADNRVHCWGSTLSPIVSAAPAPPNDELELIEMSPSGRYLLATEFGTNHVVSWSSPFPVPSPPVAMTDISPEEDYACGVRTDGTIQCWGQLTPELGAVPTGPHYDAVTTADDFACARRASDQRPVCWGDPATVGDFNQLEIAIDQFDADDGTLCVTTQSDSNLRCFGDRILNPR